MLGVGKRWKISSKFRKHYRNFGNFSGFFGIFQGFLERFQKCIRNVPPLCNPSYAQLNMHRFESTSSCSHIFTSLNVFASSKLAVQDERIHGIKFSIQYAAKMCVPACFTHSAQFQSDLISSQHFRAAASLSAECV